MILFLFLCLLSLALLGGLSMSFLAEAVFVDRTHALNVDLTPAVAFTVSAALGEALKQHQVYPFTKTL